MKRNTEDVYYGDYLDLGKLLDAQHPVSGKYQEKEAHEEMLFIIVHQVYELWFKQILHELRSIICLMARESIEERSLGMINARLGRILKVQKLLVDQIDVMETMTPLDFMDFRDYLVPASGFQSLQFKEVEIMLGLKSEYRIDFDKACFYSRLTDEHREHLQGMESFPSVFELLDRWLRRMPFLDYKQYAFWDEYRDAVDTMLARDEEIIRGNTSVTEGQRQAELVELEKTRGQFDALLDEEKYEELRQQGVVRLNHRAMLAAVFIHLYRDEPLLHQPFKLLVNVLEMDELMTTWRTRHAMMVQRMIGSKIGTGGSSGHEYLMRTAQNNRVFLDLSNLSTFLIRRSDLPALPEEMQKGLGFYFGGHERDV